MEKIHYALALEVLCILMFALFYTTLESSKACDALFEENNKLHNFVTSLRVINTIKRSLKIYCDSAMLYSNNNRSSTKLKFININYLGSRKKYLYRTYRARSMLVDSLTKGLTPKVFLKHVAHMGVTKFKPILSHYQ
ncbi:hypothetical protein CR513_60313, partial [Mucuna pruriens]